MLKGNSPGRPDSKLLSNGQQQRDNCQEAEQQTRTASSVAQKEDTVCSIPNEFPGAVSPDKTVPKTSSSPELSERELRSTSLFIPYKSPNKNNNNNRNRNIIHNGKSNSNMNLKIDSQTKNSTTNSVIKHSKLVISTSNVSSPKSPSRPLSPSQQTSDRFVSRMVFFWYFWELGYYFQFNKN